MDTKTKQGWLDMVKLFNDQAEKLKADNMRIGYHAHSHDFNKIDGTSSWDLFFGNTREDVIMQLDTSNCMDAGVDPVPVLKKYAKRATSIHIKEWGGNGFHLNAAAVEINLGSYLTFKATNLAINPHPLAGQYLVQFGSLSATLNAGVSIGGTANNFAITDTGSFVALNNFAVSLSLGQGQDAGSLKWPSWLPLKNVSIGLIWPGNSLNTNPANFIINLSAEVGGLGNIAGLSFSGGVQDV